MPVTKYNPFTETDFPAGLRVFQDTVNRLFSEGQARPWTPAVDIYETENELVLVADLPGVSMDHIDIQLENGTLTLKGERQFATQPEANGFHRIERSYGAFARYFSVPDTIDPDKVAANFKDGVLTVTLPKKEVAKPRTIKVQVNNDKK